jgi:uncharacterized DUF497 family protein
MPVRYTLQGIPFEWDPAKAASNRRKHGVEFDQACEAFFDPFLRVLDAGHEGGEARESVLGLTAKWRLLYVAFVERGEVFRIISARRATRPERKLYEGQ